MSILDRGTDVVTVYPETVGTDSDGNTITRPSPTGVVSKAVVQPVGTGLSDRENSDGSGFNTSSRYRLRLIRWQGADLGAQSQIEWNGKRFSIEGDAIVYNGSPRTARTEYVMVRS